MRGGDASRLAGGGCLREQPIACSVQAHGIGAVLDVRPSSGRLRRQRRSADDRARRADPDRCRSASGIATCSRPVFARTADEAVSGLRGQLRYRIRLACHPISRRTSSRLVRVAAGDGRPPDQRACRRRSGRLGAAIERARLGRATRNGFEPKAPARRRSRRQRGMGQLVADRRRCSDASPATRHRAADGRKSRRPPHREDSGRACSIRRISSSSDFERYGDRQLRMEESSAIT